MSYISQGERGVLFIHTKVWCPDDPIHKLIALADSHTKLLEKAKEALDDLNRGYDSKWPKKKLEAAIEEAEA
jgi:hypothetical protein